MQSATNEDREKFCRERRFWRSMLRRCNTSLYVFFLLGIAAAVIYVGARVLS